MNKSCFYGKFVVAGLITLIFLFAFSACGIAEVYVLKNGTQIKGKLKKETNSSFIINAEGIGELSIDKENVEKVLKDEKTIEEERVKSLQAMQMDDLVSSLVNSYKLQQAPKTAPVLAIIPFQTDEPLLAEEKIGFGVAEVMTDALVQKHLSEFRIVERSKLEEILSEQKLSMSGLISDNSAVKIGQILNADILLLGSISRVGDNYTVNARLVEAGSGKILAAGSISPSRRAIEKEARSYIELPENWGAYYGVRYVGLTRTPWGPVDAGYPTKDLTHDIYWKNNLDLAGVYYFVGAVRYFPVKSLLIELQISPNAISPNTPGVDGYADGNTWYGRTSASINGGLIATASWVNKFGPFYAYLGGGVFYINGCDLGAGGEGIWPLVFTPVIRGAIEWRFKKRVGINLSVDYLPLKNEFTARTNSGAEYPIYTVDPLVITVFTAFYF